MRATLIAFVLLSAYPSRSADRIQIISGVTSIAPGPDGTLYALGRGLISPTPGAYLAAPPASHNFLERFDPATGHLLYATYLNFSPSGISIDRTGAAYLIGTPNDAQFAITPGAYDRQIQGGEELVVAKLNPAATAMQYATILGGSGIAWFSAISGIAFGPDGAAYVTGTTCAKDFPVTPDAFQAVRSSGGDEGCNAFFSALSPDGSQLAYSTYLSGSKDSYGEAIAFGADGRIHLGGSATSADFPTTPGAFALPNSPGSGVFLGAAATLAWYSGGIHPVEIRESTPTGNTVARFDQTSGLLDVTPSATTTYRLVGYAAGEWIDLASATLAVSTTGCCP